MRLLLDTHAFLWSVMSPERLSVDARAAIERMDNSVFVSAAAAWEISIKYAKGALTLPIDPAIFVPSRLRTLQFAELPITHEHVLATAALPPIHADPFDRVMIAQAKCEGLTFATRNRLARRYGGAVLDV